MTAAALHAELNAEIHEITNTFTRLTEMVAGHNAFPLYGSHIAGHTHQLNTPNEQTARTLAAHLLTEHKLPLVTVSGSQVHVCLT